MPNPIIRIHDTETNEIVDREMTAEELAQYELDQAQSAAEAAEIAAKKAAKEAVMSKLGLTAEELAALTA
jgi:phosphopantetheinyl transferase (holo-ACP synthase)